MQALDTALPVAAIQKMQTRAVADREAMRLEVMEHCKREVEREIKPRIMGDMMLLILAFLRIKRGFGEKRLRQFLLDFNTFGDDAEREGLTSDIVGELLADECNIDIVELFRECERASEREKMKLRHMRKTL
jgi:hypothetical protein